MSECQAPLVERVADPYDTCVGLPSTRSRRLWTQGPWVHGSIQRAVVWLAGRARQHSGSRAPEGGVTSAARVSSLRPLPASQSQHDVVSTSGAAAVAEGRILSVFSASCSWQRVPRDERGWLVQSGRPHAHGC